MCVSTFVSYPQYACLFCFCVLPVSCLSCAVSVRFELKIKTRERHPAIRASRCVFFIPEARCIPMFMYVCMCHETYIQKRLKGARLCFFPAHMHAVQAISRNQRVKLCMFLCGRTLSFIWNICLFVHVLLLL